MNWDHFNGDEIINLLLNTLNKYYVFPEVATEMEKHLKKKLINKEYENIMSSEEFCKCITDDLQKISGDKHLKLRYSENERSIDQRKNEEEQRKDYTLQAKNDNYGFYKVERLKGNIGYIDIRSFYEPEIAGDTAVNVMNIVSNTEALIFDLRNNGGGVP